MARVLAAVLVLIVLFAPRVCCAEPQSRYVRKDASEDLSIVFVHGVLGDSIETWTNGSSYWPDLLTTDKDFDGTSIYAYEYATTLQRRGFSIEDIAHNMRLRLDADGVTKHKEIIFLAHSMGGLVVRNYLLNYPEIASRVRFIFFYSTPTIGAQVAALATFISRNPQFARMKPMQSGDYLADQVKRWINAPFNIPSFCAYETEETFGITVVTLESAFGLCNRSLDPLQADHMTIVKPSNVHSDIYISFANEEDTRTSSNKCQNGLRKSANCN